MLYDLVQCPHRVTLDLSGDPGKRDAVNPFVELLWEKGHAFERETIARLEIPFLDLRPLPDIEREARTLAAMDAGEALIYGGRIRADDLLGEPDLLRRDGAGYAAGDIKSGAGVEGENEESDGKPKRHYAVQLALYTDILERLGRSAGRRAFVWDIHGEEVTYDLLAAQGPRTPRSLWQEYETCLETARGIVQGREATLPAMASICKLCHWRTACTRAVHDTDDLTLIAGLGRSRRDGLMPHVSTVHALAEQDLAPLLRGGKTVVQGIGPDSLRKFQVRARLLTDPDARPFAKSPITLPATPTEVFFDIETDPMRDVCYLHGLVVRRDGDIATERFLAFFADEPTPEAEGPAFAQAWEAIRGLGEAVVYVYSPYERTWWRKLRERYPQVLTAEDLEALFAAPRSVDLYHLVQSATEWPTHNQSIKTIASHLGFQWRDADPSGASSIEWYHRWVEERDPAIKLRILEYNEDDCRAMRVLADGLRRLPVGGSQ